MSYPTIFQTPGVKDFAEAVDAERQRQLKKWGEQDHPDGTGGLFLATMAHTLRAECQEAADRGEVTWRHILMEECAEAFAETDPDKLLMELDQAAAVIAAWRVRMVERVQAAKYAECPSGLMPLDDLAAPIERCIVRGRHETHETAEGRKWTNADAGIEE